MKGKNMDCRTIEELNEAKVYERVIRKQLDEEDRPYIDSGFRKGYSTRKQVFSIKQLTQTIRAETKGIRVHIMFWT